MKIAPSILAADLSRLGDEVSTVLAAGADWIHFDVMDGHFVPPITFGPAILSSLHQKINAFYDVHLMIEKPENQIEEFAKAGADLITVHIEACPHLHRTIQQIHELGKQAGVAINPGTPIVDLEPIVAEVDLLLVMTVNPGWGGQSFIEHSDDRIAEARGLIQRSGRHIHLEVDGGINPQTAKRCTANGADVLVAGTNIFRSKDYAVAIASLRS